VTDGSKTSQGLQYFSTDGGKTVLADFSNSSDYGDWASNSLTTNDPFDAFLAANSNALTPVDIIELGAMGYDVSGNVATLTSNTISASVGLNAPSMTFSGTPSTTTLLTTSPEVINAGLSPSMGIQEIANFQYTTDELFLNLNGAASSALQAADTTVNGVAAIDLYNSADPTHGIVLTGMTAGQTAANLLSSHVTFSNGDAIIT
jgi:hypothetical protein